MNSDAMKIAVFEAGNDDDWCLRQADWRFDTTDQFEGDGSPDNPLSLNLCKLGQSDAGVADLSTMKIAVFNPDDEGNLCLSQADLNPCDLVSPDSFLDMPDGCNGLVCNEDGKLSAPPCVTAGCIDMGYTIFTYESGTTLSTEYSYDGYNGFDDSFNLLPGEGFQSDYISVTNDTCYDWVMNISSHLTMQSQINGNSGHTTRSWFTTDGGVTWSAYATLHNIGHQHLITEPNGFSATSWHQSEDTKDDCRILSVGDTMVIGTVIAHRTADGTEGVEAEIKAGIGFHKAYINLIPTCPGEGFFNVPDLVVQEQPPAGFKTAEEAGVVVV